MALLEVVDALVGRRNVVVKGLSPLLPRVDVLAGAALEPDGSVLLVLNADGLVAHARRLLDGSPPHPHDDAISARETPNGPGRLG
jgi:two-component system chemotaxis sensor kinase CheA